jgi:hypothetical protein
VFTVILYLPEDGKRIGLINVKFDAKEFPFAFPLALKKFPKHQRILIRTNLIST